MIEIDGAEKSGSGTLVRFAVALCTLLRQPLHMVRIRQKREKPGLRPQHLQAVRACAQLCSGRLEGDVPGSREIVYYPGEDLPGGSFEWDIGTAGSAVMMAFALITPALFSASKTQFRIRGGLFQDFAPSAFHMQKVLLPLLSRMGASLGLEMVRPGYVPKGSGEICLAVEPLRAPLNGFSMMDRGRVVKVGGIALASHLEREQVSLRMAEQCRALLRGKGYDPDIKTIDDETAVQKGAALLLWAETDTGCLIGFDMAGRRGRRSESIAENVVRMFNEDIATDAVVDRFTADQLILFAGLASGRSSYRVPRITDHIESNLWLVEKILGAGTELDGRVISIDGIGFFRK